jgi:hypothetical protein
MASLTHRLVTVVLGTLGFVLGVPRAHAADAGAPALPACVSVKTDSRYVPYGYNHIVVLTNGCARAASCTVSTDVNPEARQVSVPAGQTIELTTFMGSPSATFTAKVGCTLR